jgi:hypothetical protein
VGATATGFCQRIYSIYWPLVTKQPPPITFTALFHVAVEFGMCAGFDEVPESKSATEGDYDTARDRGSCNAHITELGEFGAQYDDDAEKNGDHSDLWALQPRHTVIHGIPVSITEDIRKTYPQMFVNTMNSGDFTQILGYFTKYMAGPCRCAIQHRIAQYYGLPQFINITGPEGFSHYLMGCFLTFPDMIMNLESAEMIQSREWSGARIVLHVQFLGSKLRDLPQYPWSPDMDSLMYLYGNMNVSSDTEEQHSPRGRSRSSDSKHSRNKSTETTHTVSSSSSNGERSHATKKRKHSKLAAGPDAICPAPEPRTPTQFVNKVISQSRVLAHPLHLHTRGTITLYLDENNCMQYVLCEQHDIK